MACSANVDLEALRMKNIAFIKQHRTDNVRTLALQASKYPEVDMPFVLEQIQGWQTARRKLPGWAMEDVLFPPHLAMEQCSSEATARYKCGIVERLISAEERRKGMMADLTGGFGVDFSYMVRGFGKAVYVERQERLCAVARHNFDCLGVKNAEVVHGDGVAYLHGLQEKVALLYLDPARRDVHGSKTYAIEDCSPDVATLSDRLIERANLVLIKLSPMLDWHVAVERMKHVCEVHIVSVDGECKELLLVMQQNGDELRLFCANDDAVFACNPREESGRMPMINDVKAGLWLYEPNASVMKGGCFGVLTERFKVKGVGRNSHLFVADGPVKGFPGRGFEIVAVSSMNRKELKEKFGGLEKANVTVRNFPLNVAELRKRLRLKEGGDGYLFATTVGGNHTLIFCKKQG